MAGKDKKNKEQEASDLLENPEAIAGQLSRTEEFVAQNKNAVLGVAIVLALLVAGFFGYKYYKNTQDQQAQSSMFQAIHYFESDSLDRALNGDGNNPGFLDIIDEYGISDAANLAHFYSGVAYLKQGKYKLAILYLEDFNADDLLVQARAYSLIGDAHMEQENYQNAVSFYEKAADYKSNEFFTPRYLMKAALAYEKMDNINAAVDIYNEIIEKYWNADEFEAAQKHKARLSNGTS